MGHLSYKLIISNNPVLKENFRDFQGLNSVLADRKRLCRLIVPKALLFQTAQIIQTRLGGPVGRIVRHIPFTRRSPANTETLQRYQALHRSTLESGGVMLCLPEYILSFKLSGLQRLADNEP